MKNGEKYPDYNNSILAYCILKLDIVGYPKMVGLFHGKSIYKCMIWGGTPMTYWLVVTYPSEKYEFISCQCMDK